MLSLEAQCNVLSLTKELNDGGAHETQETVQSAD